MAVPPQRDVVLKPPFNERPIADNGDHTHAWSAYHQQQADAIAALPDKLSTGVTDGSDAAAGKIGEYLTAVFAGPVSLSSAALVDVGTLPLPAGDWDIWGVVEFTASGTMQLIQVWVNTASLAAPAHLGRFTLAASASQFASGTRLPTGTLRVSSPGAGTAYLGASVTFPAGTVNAAGQIAARRAR